MVSRAPQPVSAKSTSKQATRLGFTRRRIHPIAGAARTVFSAALPAELGHLVHAGVVPRRGAAERVRGANRRDAGVATVHQRRALGAHVVGASVAAATAGARRAHPRAALRGALAADAVCRAGGARAAHVCVAAARAAVARGATRQRVCHAGRSQTAPRVAGATAARGVVVAQVAYAEAAGLALTSVTLARAALGRLAARALRQAAGASATAGLRFTAARTAPAKHHHGIGGASEPGERAGDTRRERHA